MHDLSTLSPRERRLLRSAQNTAGQGKRPAAIQLYQAFLAEYPNSVPGLLGLATLVDSAEDRDKLLNRVLAVEPENEIATAALQGASLSKLLAPEPPTPPAEPTPVQTVKKAAVAPPAPAIIQRTSPVDDTHTHEAETVEGGLRCNRCGKPITLKNSQHTSVGYRCNECLREIEDGMFSASTSTYIVSFLIGLVLATAVGTALALFLPRFGYFGYLITFLISSGLGRTIGSLAFRASGRNRGRYLSITMSVSIWLGAIFALGIIFLFTSIPIFSLFITLGIFAFAASSNAYLRVR